MSFLFNFEDAFILIPLDISDIEAEEDSNIDELENFNINVQMYLASKGKYKEFTVIKINLNTVRNDGEEYPYNEDDLYLKPNNVEHDDIIQMNYIYNYYILHLGSKTINNFFLKTIFKLIKKIYKKEKRKH